MSLVVVFCFVSRLRPLKGDELAKTLTRLEIEKLGQFSKCSDMTDGISKLLKSKKDDRDFEPIKGYFHLKI